jgi:4-hydroxybenzoate polyprenyltransferase
VPGVMISVAYFAHLIWQLLVLRSRGDKAALALFKSNRDAGLLVVFGMLLTLALFLLV